MDTPPAFPPSPPPLPPAAVGYSDRRTGLIVFGILEIVMGAFIALLAPVTWAGQALAARQNPGMSGSFIAPTIFMELGLAGGLIWLGIGSIQCRRWARTLVLSLAWIALCGGVLGFGFLIYMVSSGAMAETFRQQSAASGQPLPEGAFGVIAAIALITSLIFYVGIPGTLVLFYRSPHVKATCEARDPVPRWTDRCPVPVLAICILQLFSAVYLSLMPRVLGAFPFFGFVVTGWPSWLLWGSLIVFCVYAATGFYRLNARVWLAYTASMCVWGLSSIITFLRIPALDYYRQAGFPDKELQFLAASPLMRGNSLVWTMLPSMVIFLGFLLFLRRYFPAQTDSSPPSS